MTAAALAVGTAREVERAVLDYLAGWLDRSPGRIAHVLHPRLAKRTLIGGELIDATAAAAPDGAIAVDVVHVEGASACAVVRAAGHVEYLHLVDAGEGWRIVNSLWHRS